MRTASPSCPTTGYPLRLVLPGWVGIASIKWLGSLEVSTTELTSPWNTQWYNVGGPLTVNPVRSAWELAWEARIRSRRTVELTGRSWSGAAPIARVEVSTDGGATWSQARLRPSPGLGQGRRRPYDRARLDPLDPHVARAGPRRPTSCSPGPPTSVGRTQPDVAAYNPNGYFFDAVVRHPVTVV